jgi:tetratricopeptide (TPR) repeat protein
MFVCRSLRSCLTLAVSALLACSNAASLTAAEEEMAVRNQMWRATSEVFQSRNFELLDRTLTQLLQQKARTPSGVWKLSVMDRSLTHEFDKCGGDSACWDKVEADVTAWRDTQPNSVNAHLMYAKMLMMRAWSIRGGGYANSVDPANWQPFHDYMERARSYLSEHRGTIGDDPRWYQYMIDIAKVQKPADTEFENFLERALSKNPDFYEIYFAAVDYYTPRWGGDAEKLEATIKSMLRFAPDDEVASLYARMYWYASQVEFTGNMFDQTATNWPAMKRGFEEIVAKYPDLWNLNHFLKFACFQGDLEQARVLSERVGSNMVAEAWNSPELFTECQKWAQEML